MTAAPDGAGGTGRRSAPFLVALVLAALLPSLGTLHAPWLAEDASVVARLAADGPWADWNRPWFGMEIVRFWRPLVSLAWGVQLALCGLDPFALRLLNLGLHAGCALLVFGCVLRLGGNRQVGMLAGLWVAWFPDQGGTVTWLSGRTDLLGGFWLLASVFAALGRKPWRAAPCAFLAASAKEFGFLAPLWCALALHARGAPVRQVVRQSLPALLATGVAFVWRAFALDGVAGGYAGELPGPLAGLWGAQQVLRASLSATGPSAIPFSLALLAIGLGGRLFTRGSAALLAAAGLALVPLHPLLADGVLEPQNARLLFVPTLGLALWAGFGMSAWGPRERLLWPGVVLLVFRAQAAWNDTHEWAHAAEVSARALEDVRARVDVLEPGPAPVLVAGLPMSVGGAYALGFGVAERFAPPFPATPRPVWPWRLLFVEDPRRARAPLGEARADALALPVDGPLTVPELALTSGGARVSSLALDERIYPRGEDRSDPLELAGGPPGAVLEVVLVTPAGYEVFPAGALDAAGGARVSVRALLALSNGVALAAETLAQAADLGARRAYLEVRALDAQGTLLAAARGLELTWPSDLARR